MGLLQLPGHDRPNRPDRSILTIPLLSVRDLRVELAARGALVPRGRRHFLRSRSRRVARRRRRERLRKDAARPRADQPAPGIGAGLGLDPLGGAGPAPARRSSEWVQMRGGGSRCSSRSRARRSIPSRRSETRSRRPSSCTGAVSTARGAAARGGARCARCRFPTRSGAPAEYPHRLSGGQKQRAMLADRARGGPGAAHRRRADDGARRDGRRGGPGAARAAAAAPRA